MVEKTIILFRLNLAIAIKLPKTTDNIANIEKIVDSHCIDNFEKILHQVFCILMQNRLF